MPEPERVIGGRLHEIITAIAPVLSPGVWYGMPVCARYGRVVCFFEGREKFKDEIRDVRFPARGAP